MDGLAAWISRITWPIVSRVFAALGFGTVTYAGANTALAGALNAVRASFSGMTADLLNLLLLSGFFDAMSIMSGGLTSALAWMVLKRFALQTTGQTS
ncbi:hypothetical protein J2W25_001909 [Variovorax boronicumulans]|uniref:DUF2523 domain-containing protein n=1 Tax=Variovorax boronicumulans TaxID=436515 RepID=A0AAW8DTJ7_9BURK|nr:DUF2523 domain-containing protein [Variovorax boronicumulans]MDP9877603.1 hypothetical protein [Variovorax boronicumulans]MDP9922888.1 hypothetical protein [Variovorax boronicumulans]